MTKFRAKALSAPILDRLQELTRERVEAWEGEVLEFGGESDHVHIVFSLPPKFAVAAFVNAFKTGTSRRLRNEYPEHFATIYRRPVLWSQSYCVVTSGGAPLEVLRRYIEEQDSSKS